jgi:hypothetical protein
MARRAANPASLRLTLAWASVPERRLSDALRSGCDRSCPGSMTAATLRGAFTRRSLLCFGPPFVGKTYLAHEFTALGLNAYDSVAVPDLTGWCDRASGAPVTAPPGGPPTAAFLAANLWRWDGDVLHRFLAEHARDGVILFGQGEAAVASFPLFDLVVALEIDPEELERRFLANKRRNPFGRRTEQQELIRDAHRAARAAARRERLPIVDASQQPTDVAAQLARLVRAAETTQGAR